ncbi:hypothetical protein SMQE08_08750 [Serratia marcescens]|nr:hypothetical protein SMQE08_08750 [Serratia marcescens]
MGNLIFLDSVVFFITLIVVSVYVRHFNKKYKMGFAFLVLMFFYVICSYSSYNIMVKPIHDYNLAIPRTFIFHFKVIGPLVPLDILCVVTLLFIVLRKLSSASPTLISINSTVSVYVKYMVLQGGFFAILSTVSFFVYLQSGGKGVVTDQLISFRGVLYFIIFIYLFQLCSNRVKEMDFYTLFKFFVIVDFINAVSGFISSLIYKDYVWSRYGMNISIIDQDDVYNFFTIYAVLLVSLFLTKPLKRKSIYLLSIIIGILVYANMYKYVFVVGAIYFIYDFVINALKGRIAILKLGAVAIAAVFLASAFLMLSTSKSMNTRSGQISDYWEYTGSKFPANLIGIGNGGQFYSPTDTDDDGEIKVIDKENNATSYRKSIQTPFVSFIKVVGPLGIIVLFGFSIFSILKVSALNLSLPYNVIYNAVLFNLLWILAVSTPLFQVTPFTMLTITKLLIFVCAFRSESETVRQKTLEDEGT